MVSNEIMLDRPNPKQDLFLRETHPVVNFGGARGGGKSWAIRFKAIILCLVHEGIKVMIVRKTYPELTANHINPLKEILRCGSPMQMAKYNENHKEIRFPNGSVILFRYCDTEKDVDRFQGTEVDVLCIDEATQMSEMQYKKLAACVRGVNNFPKRIYLTCNPGGQGHGWVKRLFIDRNFKPGENPDDYVFIKSKVTDNTAMMRKDPGYIKYLEALPPKIRKAWLDGDFNILDGQFFEEFVDDEKHYDDRQWTHVIRPFDIPPDWKIYRSYDYGYAKPFSCAWWAIDYDGILYRIIELYGCTDTPNEGVKWTADKQFKEIARIEREHPYLKNRKILGVADPAIWGDATGISIADVAAKNGVFFSKGNNDRIAGWQQMHYRLAFDDNGYPMMYVFSNCKGFIRTIPELLYSTTRPEDLDTSMEDHIADESRYMCMSRPIKPRLKATNLPIQDDPLNMISDALNQRNGNINKNDTMSIFHRV